VVGAFWEDRYHATAVETNQHLVQCLVYMDLNMVRAGVVSHPHEWNESGYGEIHQPRLRYTLIDSSVSHGSARHTLSGSATKVTQDLGGRISQRRKNCKRRQVVIEHCSGKQRFRGNGEEATRFEGEGSEDH